MIILRIGKIFKVLFTEKCGGHFVDRYAIGKAQISAMRAFKPLARFCKVVSQGRIRQRQQGPEVCFCLRPCLLLNTDDGQCAMLSRAKGSHRGRFSLSALECECVLLYKDNKETGKPRQREQTFFDRGTGDRTGFCLSAVEFSSARSRARGPRLEKAKNFDKTPGTEQNFAWAPLIAPLQDQGQGPACHA